MFGATYLIIFPRFMFTRVVEILITTCEQRTFIGCQKTSALLRGSTFAGWNRRKSCSIPLEEMEQRAPDHA